VITLEERRVIFGNSMWEKFRESPLPIHIAAVTRTAADGMAHTTKPHYHDFAQLWYCTAGQYIHTVDGVTRTCRAGSLVIVPPGVTHCYKVEKGLSVAFVQLNFMFTYFGKSDSDITAVTRLFFYAFHDKLGFEPELFFEFSGNEKEHIDAVIQKLISHSGALEQTLRIFTPGKLSLPESVLLRARKFREQKYIPLIRTVYYMNLNFMRRITVDELLEISGLSRTQYFKFFRLAFGVTFSTYLQLIRVSHAAVLCKFTRYSFSYIADMCGFGNHAYMINRIKKLSAHWSTPSEMRRDRRNQISQYPDMLMSRNEYEKLTPHFQIEG